jgi:glycosyltransferase involved in cell wall biosynthesis
MNPDVSTKRTVLVYEPNVEGHHVGWLRFITEDLLAAGFSLTLALDTRPAAMERIENQMADLLPQVKIIPAVSQKSDEAKITSPAHVAACLKKSGAALAFLAHFNDIASTLQRRTAFGLMPDESLRGRLGGIYLRPQFLNAGALSPNQAIKKFGFHRLIQNGWLNPLLLLDPLLCEIAQKKYPDAPIHLLADPYPENFHADRAASRKFFNLTDDKFVFLFYGGGYKRKGLHLAVEAMLKTSAPDKAFLLCAGLQPKGEQLARNLEMLRSQGRAEIVNRYVSAEEEKQLFAACDAVLLPYLHHHGTSGVLSCTAGTGKPAIASDEHFIGQVVRQYQMGLLFESGNVSGLKNAMKCAASASAKELSKWQAGAQAYAKTCSRGAFRSALVAAVENAIAKQN